MPDPRYATAKILLEKKAITAFKEIFTYIPYTIVADDLRTNHNRMKKMIRLLDYDYKKLMLLAGLDVDRLGS